MNVRPNNWMSHFQSAPIYDLMIPGTHDSATEGFSVGSPSRTQYYKINEQLAAGVRFLDMRLAHNSVEDNFHVVHGTDVTSWLNFDTVVEWCADFLKHHSTETILMSIKQEGERPGPDAAFAADLSDWHARQAAKGRWKSDLWYTTVNEVPTVAQAKGKIVLLRRYVASAPSLAQAPLFYGGLDLSPINRAKAGTTLIAQPPNPHPTPNPLPGVFCSWQDEFEQGHDEKKPSIAAMLKRMAHNGDYLGKNHQWFLNFASTASPGPLRAANEINPWLEDELKKLTRRIHGVLLTDYAQPELWKRIYEINLLP